MKQHAMKWKKWLASGLAVVLLSSLPGAASAQAKTVEAGEVPYDVYINASLVTLNDALFYGGHTYVQLRELAGLINMDVEFVKDHPGLVPGGALLEGIHISQPTFVYTKDRVIDSNHLYGDEYYITGVDITTIKTRYDADKGNFAYAFDRDHLIVPDGDGTKTIPLRVIYQSGKQYVSVDEFREKIQPYLIDICMQDMP